MLSSVLRSARAVEVNIEIVRAFVQLRRFLSAHKELAQKLAQLERKIGAHDEQIQVIFKAIRQLMAPSEPKKRKIGFLVEEKAASYGRR
jgi:DNA-binding transcriptional MerR regulator